MLPKFFPSPHLIISTIIFLLSNHFLVSTLCEDSQYVKCSFPVECEGLGKIEYPFWVDGDQPAYCGHPAFKLDCMGSTATINIMYQKYVVISITYEARIMRIARTYGVLMEHILCPERNTTLFDSPFFEYTSNTQNATLFYKCPPEFEHPGTRNFSCLKYGGLDRAFFTVNASLATELVSICGAGVVVPVLATAAQGIMNGSLDFHQVLRDGFEVKWRVEEGAECVETGGRCGYNWGLDQSICYCPDRSYYSTSCPTLMAPPQIAPTPTTLYTPNSSMYPFPYRYLYLYSVCSTAY